MGLLQKLKSALGLDGATSSGTRQSGDVDVTVEREPSTEDEDAVKGTDTAESSAESDTSETESDPVVTDTEADDDEPDSSDNPQGSGDPVTEIKGIGPAYADRLHGQGIETVSQLADADPAAIAAETDLGEGRVSDWVERAHDH